LNPESPAPFLRVLPETDLAVNDRKHFKILVVEDNVVNQKILVRLLRLKGYASVTLAGNGQVAIDTISRLKDVNEYDAILMDCEMPICDGFHATEHIRRMGCQTTIIALTASATKENRDRCAKVGMDLYHVKPIDINSLVTTFSQIQPNVYV